MCGYADMLGHMRTTMNLPDDLYRALRVHAAERGVTATSVMEQALRDLLAGDERSTYRVRPLETFRPGHFPDIDDNASLRDQMDADEHAAS